MSLADALVYRTIYNDGSADFTINVDEEDHQFSAVPSGSNALVEYEETLSWRGEIRTKEPREEVWRMLMQSEEMTEYLEEQGLTGVQREKR